MWALVRLCVCECARERISVHNRNETSGFKAPQKLISSEKQKWCEPPTAAAAAAEAERERAEVVAEAYTRAADERRRRRRANVFIMGPKQRSRRSMRFVVAVVVFVDGAFNFLQGEQVARQVVRERGRGSTREREIRLYYNYYYYYCCGDCWESESKFILHLMLYNCYCCCCALV